MKTRLLVALVLLSMITVAVVSNHKTAPEKKSAEPAAPVAVAPQAPPDTQSTSPVAPQQSAPVRPKLQTHGEIEGLGIPVKGFFFTVDNDLFTIISTAERKGCPPADLKIVEQLSEQFKRDLRLLEASLATVTPHGDNKWLITIPEYSDEGVVVAEKFLADLQDRMSKTDTTAAFLEAMTKDISLTQIGKLTQETLVTKDRGFAKFVTEQRSTESASSFRKTTDEFRLLGDPPEKWENLVSLLPQPFFQAYQ